MALLDVRKEWIALPVNVGLHSTTLLDAARTSSHVRVIGRGQGITVARAIHAASGRGDRPFLSFDFKGLPTSLIHSEMFGHLAESFPGAFRPYPGRIWKIDGGTLVVGAIDRLDAHLRSVIRQCADTGDVWPLGARASAGQVDVRLIELVAE